MCSRTCASASWSSCSTATRYSSASWARTFGISINSEGAESIDKFTSKNIKEVRIIFTPGVDFENMIGRAEFNMVASRAAQVATLKAEKAGEDTVDLAAAKASTAGTASTTEPGGEETDGQDDNEPMV